jgi:pimeloyl-ACP methyl ester carboxylesterase
VVSTDGLGQVRLPDGRTLDVWQGGDPRGVPVVYFHGTPAGRLQAALGDGAARRAGVRLLAFSRPGYGASSDTATTLTSVARDALDLADQLEIGELGTLGASGGGPFALATAAVDPDRVSAVGVVAGVASLTALDPTIGDDPAVRLALSGDMDGAVAVNDTSFGAPLDVSLEARDEQPVGARPAPAPGESTLPPEMLEPWAADLRDALPTYRGASRDSIAFAVGWDVDLAAVTAPVWLWYGDRDQLVPLEHGRWLHERLPTSTLVVREGAGHLGTLMPYWHDILTTLTGNRSR